MKYAKINTIRCLFCALCVALLIGMAGCVTGPRMADHAFEFDGFSDKWSDQVNLLEYSYGDKYRMVRDKAKSPDGRLSPAALVSGIIPIGEFLYVKWRIKATGEVREDRVDLRPLLPRDINGDKLTFVIDGRQLYIYLVTEKPTPYSRGMQAPLKTFLSKYNVTYEIYPTNTFPR